MPFRLDAPLHLAGRFTHRAVRVAVVLVVTAATLALSAVALLPAFGARAMAVTSGSMQPAIDVGALVVVRAVDSDTIQPGDVIAFRGHSREGVTTHRVVDRHVVAGRLHFRTQGDANDTPDVDLAPAEGVVGRVGLDVPHAGRLLVELQGPVLRLAVVGVALWIGLTQVRALRGAARVGRAGRSGQVSGRPAEGAAVLCLLVALAAVVEWPGSGASGAVLSDGASVTDNTFTTGAW